MAGHKKSFYYVYLGELTENKPHQNLLFNFFFNFALLSAFIRDNIRGISRCKHNLHIENGLKIILMNGYEEISDLRRPLEVAIEQTSGADWRYAS